MQYICVGFAESPQNKLIFGDSFKIIGINEIHQLTIENSDE